MNKYQKDLKGWETQKNFQRLIFFLIENGDNWFNQENKATSFDDFESFNQTVKFDHLINYGDHFLVDAIDSQMWIVKLTKREFSLPDGRLVPFKLVHKLINNCHISLGDTWNGYWMIPNFELLK